MCTPKEQGRDSHLTQTNNKSPYENHLRSSKETTQPGRNQNTSGSLNPTRQSHKEGSRSDQNTQTSMKTHSQSAEKRSTSSGDVPQTYPRTRVPSKDMERVSSSLNEDEKEVVVLQKRIHDPFPKDREGSPWSQNKGKKGVFVTQKRSQDTHCPKRRK